MRGGRFVWISVVAIAVAVVAVFLVVRPQTLPASATSAPHQIDLANGERIFIAGNCSACHMSAGQDDRHLLGGGLKLNTAFGTFTTPNISPDQSHGIGAWSELQFLNAMKRGVGARNEHLYPAFPYTFYARLRTADARDLFAYIKTLPASDATSAGHHLKFPFSIRPLLGFWKLLYFRPADFVADQTKSAAWNRGAYLVEAAAHCSACHTPHDSLGGERQDKAFSGAPSLEPGGRFATNITPSPAGIGAWSVEDLAEFLKSGQDSCFNEPVGMQDVVASTSQLSDEDLAAIAAYVFALPPIPDNSDHKTC
jgi:mono/diheme cytochrome c family protein